MNGSHIAVLEEPPSALDFLRLVRVARPVVIKGVLHIGSPFCPLNGFDKKIGYDIRANAALWTDEYLAETMDDQHLSVAVTPNG